ncbi:unnamed protein product [Toxocara canis]|uniref:Aa_trans domain-containing protein n=1 Tax=Toxocara canis TaxID=6265 RepID=A0A183U4V2_TOXCA|nr:unnamed protein product [Toxocara canis]
MSIVTAAYILMSAALTLMVPFREVNPAAAFSDAFASRGAEWAKCVVAVGALSGMTTSLDFIHIVVLSAAKTDE